MDGISYLIFVKPFNYFSICVHPFSYFLDPVFRNQRFWLLIEEIVNRGPFFTLNFYDVTEPFGCYVMGPVIAPLLSRMALVAIVDP
jgi:hypothetical protein